MSDKPNRRKLPSNGLLLYVLVMTSAAVAVAIGANVYFARSLHSGPAPAVDAAVPPLRRNQKR